MIRLSILLILILNVVFGFAQKELELDCEVRHVSSKLNIDGRQVFYALPKNTIRIEVELKKTIQFKGPYSDFAQKYLNISEGVIQAHNEYYSIESVKFHRLSLPDSSKFYSISGVTYADLPLLQLNTDGVIIGCNLKNNVVGYSTETEPMLKAELEVDEYLFTDMGVKPFLIEKEETLYKTVQTDSTPKKVRYKKTKLVPTTIENNAYEAAAFIRKIRKRRLKLLVGEKEEVIDVDGVALNRMANELKILEEKYLELFLGKTIEKSSTYYFNFDPDEEINEEKQIVGWFSDSKGLRIDKPDIRRSDFQPLLLKAKAIGKIPEPKVQVMDRSGKTPVSIKYGLYYRIPGRIDITLQFIDQILGRQQWEIAQKGVVAPLPVGYLNNTNYSIEFYPETGALKRIFLKN